MKILAAVICLKIVFSTSSAQTFEELKEKFTGDKFPTGDDLGNVTVNTNMGAITGKKILDADGDEIHMFLGIPFAEPPVGSQRFRPPRPVMKYDNLEAFNYGSICPQFDYFDDYKFVGDEDCLSLSVFLKSTNDTALKPVMFYIYGGGFSSGSVNIYNPSPLVKEDVIVVNANYRLAALGFLTMGNDLAPGNLGLRDQILALQWVKSMIVYFGGNPNQITIFGESAGAMSCHALTMSPKAMGLMSAAIYHSGTMLIQKQKYEVDRPYRYAAAVADYFNCSSSNLDMEMLDCLQGVDAQELLQVTGEGSTVLPEIAGGFQPNTDAYSRDPVMPIDYLSAMKNGYFNRIPVITGTMLKDGLLFLPEDDYGSTWNETGSKTLYIKSSFNTSETTAEETLQANLIKRFYTGKDAGKLIDHVNDFADMMTDSWFLSPDQKFSELASKYVPVYNYRFTYKGQFSVVPAIIYGREEQFDSDLRESLKPAHGDDLPYPFDLTELNEEDMKMREVMVKYWTNFAKYGHPSPLMADNITQWLPYSADKNYMELKPEPEMMKNVEKERMAFWQRIHWNQRENEVDKNQSFLTTPLFYMLRLLRVY